MNSHARRENARTLAAALGIDETVAAELLGVSVAMTFAPRDGLHADFAKHIQLMLSRTVREVALNQPAELTRPAAEIVIGSCTPRFDVPRVFVSIGSETVIVGSQPVFLPRGDVHPIAVLLGSCYAVAATLKTATNNFLPFPSPKVFRVDLAELVGEDFPTLYRRACFDEAYLAGAGAIGNGFVYGLGCFNAEGRLHIADDDMVSDGNLQRCVLFGPDQVDMPKAEQLCIAAKQILPTVEAIPHVGRLQEVPARFGGPWLKRLIVGVDSPRARRSLQTEIPREVFDASTTGISEIVLHFHQQPTLGACMSCVYHHSPQEDAHENHVADALGVSLADVLETRISPVAAQRICRRYPELDPAALAGIAYDTLFKRLCSTAQLKRAEDRQVLTPFAFVSVLAGALLAIEFVRRVQRGHDGLFNEWRVSPWANPVLRRRRIVGRRADCEFCGDALIASTARQIWEPQ